MEAGASLDNIEVVDTLIKDSMSEAYKKLMYVKDQFKRAPRNYNATDTRIKIIYKEKVESDQRAKEEADNEKLELLSMKDYIAGFCKKFNINLRLQPFPIQLFMDQPMNAAFINYKKRKLFDEVVETVQLLARQIHSETQHH